MCFQSKFNLFIKNKKTFSKTYIVVRKSRKYRGEGGIGINPSFDGLIITIYLNILGRIVIKFLDRNFLFIEKDQAFLVVIGNF